MQTCKGPLLNSVLPNPIFFLELLDAPIGLHELRHAFRGNRHSGAGPRQWRTLDSKIKRFKIDEYRFKVPRTC